MTISLRAAVLCLLLGAAACSTPLPPELPCSRDEVRRSPFLKRLVRQESVAEAERGHMFAGVAFGTLAAQWEEMKARMRPGDQLWRFSRAPHVYPQGALEGYVVLRGCEVVDQLVLSTD